jgi:hypothetical protein
VVSFCEDCSPPNRQEETILCKGARKDIERAFRVLQARWGVNHGPAYGWDRERLSDIMTACIIMHNMIVEDERG